MAEHADQALQAAIKALAEVVSPAVDPQDALAVDQLRLVISWLQFDATHRHRERGLARAELGLRIALAADALHAIETAVPAIAAALQAALGDARAAHARGEADAETWRAAALRLDTLVSDAVTATADGPAPARSALAAQVLAHSKDHLMIRRAWFAPLGFEARPDALPPMETWLDAAARGRTDG